MDVRVPKSRSKRGKGCALRVAVPTEYQPIIVKMEIVRGLGTQDPGEALRRRKEVLAETLAALANGSYRKPRVLAAHSRSPPGSTRRRSEISPRDGWRKQTVSGGIRQRYRQDLETLEAFTGSPDVSKIDGVACCRFRCA